jgi:DNA-binding CsgD family transcriptional regulator
VRRRYDREGRTKAGLRPDGPVISAVSPARRKHLLERADELATLRRCVDAAASGTGAACVIEGAAGIGKTALLSACRDLSEDAGLKTLWAQAGLLEQDLPWNLVRQLFGEVIEGPKEEREELLSGAAALAGPALGLSSGADAGALHGLYWLLADLAQRNPLLVAIDDAHWGDLPSLRYLAYLSERVTDLPLLLAVTTRTGEEDLEELGALCTRAASTLIALRELGPRSSAVLVRGALGGGAADRFCAACHEATAGNPYLLEELLTQLREDEVKPLDEHAEEVAGVTPGSVARSVLLRLSRLSADARKLAGAVAVLGSETEPSIAADLAGLGPEVGRRTADALARAQVLRPGAPLEFVHPIVREAVYSELPPLERARHHREAARLLDAAGIDRERVAAQLLNTEPEGDTWVIGRLREAAARAIAEGAPGPAANLLERTLRERLDDGVRAQLLLELGIAEGRSEVGGADRMRDALDLASEPHQRAEIALALGRTVGLAGHHAQAADVLERGLAESHDDRELRIRLEAELAGHCVHAAEKLPLGLELLAGVGLDRAPRGTAERLLQVIAASALIASGRITPAQAREIAIAAARDRSLFEQEGSYLVFFIAETLLFADYPDDAASVLDEMIDDARARGSAPGVALASAFRAQVALRRGAVQEAEADGRTALEMVDPEVLGYSRPYALSFLLDPLVERGELEEADELLDSAGPSGDWPELWQFGLLVGSRGRLRLAQGRPREAVEDLLECGRRLAPWAPRNPGSVAWRSDAALALASLGERDEAERLVDWELRHARAVGARRPLGVTLRAAGVVQGGTPGAELLTEAVALLEASGAKLEHARALTDLGVVLRQSGSRARARGPLRLALDLADRCGAIALADRARRELVVAGARPRRDRIAGRSALTASELRVAEMAAGGMTNREVAQALFLSLRTVETHLTHAYQKLDIGSREELPVALSGERSERD